MNESVFDLQRLALEMIAAKRPTDEILDSLCKLVQEIVPHGLATVMRFDAEANTLTFCNAPSAPASVLDAFGALTPGPFAGSCGSSVYERKMVAVENTSTDPRWDTLRSVAEKFEIRSCWSVPIFVGEDEIVGTFAISRSVHGTPSPDERRLLEMAAYLAGVVIRLDRSEKECFEHNSLLAAIVECAEDPIFVKDRNGRYRLVNEAEARLRGKSKAEVIGKTDAELDSPFDVRAVVDADKQVFTTNGPVVHEVEVRGPNGQVRDFLVRKDPLRDASGEVAGVVGISRDLTERRRVEQAMQQAQKLESLGVLAGGIAHDFNNLLVGVMANANMLAVDERISDCDLLKSVRDIAVAAERAAELTRQMLQYAGKRKPARECLSLTGLLEEVPDLLASGISKKVQLTVDLDEDLPPVEVDPVQMRQVLMNLILNASEAFGDRDGAIDVLASLRREQVPTGHFASPDEPPCGDWIRISVVDNGCGMDGATVTRIFDPFYTTKTKGRGLGLAAVLGIVGSHGGYLEVDSREGRGTTFHIWLPVDLASVESSVEQNAPVEVARPEVASNGRVLIVEDEPSIRDVLSRIMKVKGFTPEVARDGEEGLDRFCTAAERFDLVILDLTMPGLSGDELAEQIRMRDDQVPIVLTSGLGELDAQGSLGEDWVDAFLGKPFGPDQVLEAVREAVEKRQLLTS